MRAGGVVVRVAGASGGTAGEGGVVRPEVAAGERKLISGEGLTPNEPVEVWLPGDAQGPPRRVGTAEADAAGGFRLQVDVFDGVPLPIGRSVLQIVGTTGDGQALFDVPFEVVQGDPAPEVERVTGLLPDVAGGPVTTIAGLPTDATITPEPDVGRVRVDTGPVETVITGTVQEQEADTARIVTTLDGPIEVAVSGAMPATRVDVWAFSTPMLLGSITTGADGTGTATLTADRVDVGLHTLQVQTIGPDGYVTAVNLPLAVTPPEDAPDGQVTIENASTATTSTPWTALVVALALGVLAVALMTRRRTSTRPPGDA